MAGAVADDDATAGGRLRDLFARLDRCEDAALEKFGSGEEGGTIARLLSLNARLRSCEATSSRLAGSPSEQSRLEALFLRLEKCENAAFEKFAISKETASRLADLQLRLSRCEREARSFNVVAESSGSELLQQQFGERQELPVDAMNAAASAATASATAAADTICDDEPPQVVEPKHDEMCAEEEWVLVESVPYVPEVSDVLETPLNEENKVEDLVAKVPPSTQEAPPPVQASQPSPPPKSSGCCVLQ
jgi:hypothetical protein